MSSGGEITRSSVDQAPNPEISRTTLPGEIKLFFGRAYPWGIGYASKTSVVNTFPTVPVRGEAIDVVDKKAHELSVMPVAESEDGSHMDRSFSASFFEGVAGDKATFVRLRDLVIGKIPGGTLYVSGDSVFNLDMEQVRGVDLESLGDGELKMQLEKRSIIIQALQRFRESQGTNLEGSLLGIPNIIRVAFYTQDPEDPSIQINHFNVFIAMNPSGVPQDLKIDSIPTLSMY